MRLGVAQSATFLPVSSQNPHDRHDRVPIPRRRRHTEQFVDLPEVADRFHVTTVHTEDKSISHCEDSQKPLPVAWKCDRYGRPNAAILGQDAHESNNVRSYRLGPERILRLQADEITAIAEHKFRFERQLPEHFRAQLRSRSRLSNDQCACGADVDDIVSAQFPREDTWAKRPVSADIDPSQENNESHTEIITKRPGVHRGHAVNCTRVTDQGGKVKSSKSQEIEIGCRVGAAASSLDGRMAAVGRTAKKGKKWAETTKTMLYPMLGSSIMSGGFARVVQPRAKWEMPVWKFQPKDEG